MNIKQPFDSKLNVNENMKNFFNHMPNNEKKLTVRCIDVSTQANFTTEITWKDILNMHNTPPNNRKKTTYNQVSYCLAKLENFKDAIQQPEFIKKK